MALETDSAAVDDIIHATLIAPFMVKALTEQPRAHGFARQINMTEHASPAIQLPIAVSWWGTPNDRGGSVDAELNATENVAVGNTQFTTTSVTLTPSAFAVQLTVSDKAREDSV